MKTTKPTKWTVRNFHLSNNGKVYCGIERHVKGVKWRDFKGNSCVYVSRPIPAWKWAGNFVGCQKIVKEVRSVISSPTNFFLLLQQITFSILIWNSKKNRGSSTFFAQFCHMRRRMRVSRWWYLKPLVCLGLRFWNLNLNFFEPLESYKILTEISRSSRKDKKLVDLPFRQEGVIYWWL